MSLTVDFFHTEDSVAAPVPSNVFLVIDVLEVNVCAHELGWSSFYLGTICAIPIPKR